MAGRAAVVTQADIARTIRAAKQAGACAVEVRPNGTVLVHLTAATIHPGANGSLEGGVAPAVEDKLARQAERRQILAALKAKFGEEDRQKRLEKRRAREAERAARDAVRRS